MAIVRWRKNPIEFEAVQWTGDNYEELIEFTKSGIHEYIHDTHTEVLLWVQANERYLPLVVGEWVVKDELGFYPCKDEIMQKNNTKLHDSVYSYIRSLLESGVLTENELRKKLEL